MVKAISGNTTRVGTVLVFRPGTVSSTKTNTKNLHGVPSDTDVYQHYFRRFDDIRYYTT